METDTNTTPETSAKSDADKRRMQQLVRLSEAQREVVQRLNSGEILNWYGYAGPEISGRERWPVKRTVRAMLKNKTLIWGDYRNDMQKAAGIRPLHLHPDYIESNSDDERGGASGSIERSAEI